MRGIQARIDDIFSKANGGKAEHLSETDESVATAEKPAQVLKTIQPALTHSHSTAYLREVLQARQEQTEDRQKAQRTAFTIGMGREGSTVPDVDRRAPSATTMDLTGEQNLTPVDTKITSSFRIFKSGSRTRQGLSTSGVEPYSLDEKSSEINIPKDRSGRPFLSSTGRNYRQPIYIDEDDFISSPKSRKTRSIQPFKNEGPATEEEARRDVRAEQEMHKEAAKMEKNLAIKRQAARDNEVKARNKRPRFSLMSSDALPIAKTVIRRGVRTNRESPLSQPWGHQIQATDHEPNSLGVPQDVPERISGEETTITDLDDVTLTSGNALSNPALCSALDTPEHTNILSPMTLVNDSLPNPLSAHRVSNPKPNEGGGPSENWCKRFLTPEESRLFPEAHQNGSSNPSSLVCSEPSSSTDLLRSVNVQEGGSVGNHSLTFEKPLLFPETCRDGPGNLNPLVFFDTSPSSDPQAQNADIHKPSEDGDLSELHLPTFKESLILPETQHDGSGNHCFSLFSSTDPSIDQQAQNANIHNPVEGEGSSGEEALFFPEVHLGGHTAISESVTENGHYYNVVGSQISAELRAKALETAESALVHSDEIDSLFVDPERSGNAEAGRELCTPLIQPSSVKEPEPSWNDGNAREEHSSATGKQFAASFSNDPQEAVDLRHVQEDKPNVERKTLKLEHMDCKTDVRMSVEDLNDAGPGIQHTQALVDKHTPNHEECRKDASLKPKPGQSKLSGATTRTQKMTTPERKEAKKTSLKKYKERKREALRYLEGQTSMNPLDTLRRSSSEIAHASADGDRLGSANSTPGTINDEGLVTTPRKRRMSTPERKEAKRRARQKYQAKKKLEKMSQNGQSSSSPPETSTQPSSQIPNNSSEDKDSSEEQNHCQSRIPGHNPSDTTTEGSCEDGKNKYQSQRPTSARKGVAKKSPVSFETVQPDIVRNESPDYAEQEEDDIEPEIEGTEEEMLFHYFVKRTEFRLDEPDDEPAEILYGPYHTLSEANTVASDALLDFHSSNSYSTENNGGWKSDANGLKSWHFTSATTEVEVAVTREIKRKARLPNGAGRIPPKVYEAYQRRVEFINTPAGKTYTHVHLGTFTLLDLANRHAARAWVAVKIEAMPDTAYTREVARPVKEKEMRGVCEELEAKGGFFKRCARVGMEGRMGEVEVEVWVGEREVVGPRN